VRLDLATTKFDAIRRDPNFGLFFCLKLTARVAGSCDKSHDSKQISLAAAGRTGHAIAIVAASGEVTRSHRSRHPSPIQMNQKARYQHNY